MRSPVRSLVPPVLSSPYHFPAEILLPLTLSIFRILLYSVSPLLTTYLLRRSHHESMGLQTLGVQSAELIFK